LALLLQNLLENPKRSKVLIDSYKFGVIVINGKSYSSDVIVYPERVDDKWVSKEGHLLLREDLGKVVEEHPDVLVVGTGNPGLMEVPQSTRSWLESKGIEVRIQPTREACLLYNRLAAERKTIAVLHLTC